MQLLTDLVPEFTLADACEVRDALMTSRTSAGESLIGVAVRPEAGNRALPFGPGFTWLSNRMLMPGQVVPVAGLLESYAIARAVLPVDQPPRRFRGCIEIVTRCFGPGEPGPLNELAANGFTRRVIMSEPKLLASDDPLEVSVCVDGKGPTVAAYEPRTSFAELIERTRPLAHGLVNMDRTGSLTVLLSAPLAPPVPVTAGSRLSAHFGPAARVTLRLVGKVAALG